MKSGFKQTQRSLKRRGVGRRCTLPIRLEILGERRKLSQRGLGRAPAKKLILCIFEVRRSRLGHLFSAGQAHIKISLFKKHCAKRYGWRSTYQF